MTRWRWMLVLIVLGLSGAVGFWLSLRHEPLFYSSTPVMQTFHSPATFVRQIEGDPAAGQKIFKMFCAVCHDNPPQIDVDAPRVGDKKAWGLREKWGRAAMLKMTLQGVGAMPARGGCFECSDAQIEQAVDYILRKTK